MKQANLFGDERRDDEHLLDWLTRIPNPMAVEMRRASHFLEFVKFAGDNPHVRVLFERFAMEGIMSGRDNFGARMVWERIRWYTDIETTDLIFKVNNNFIAYYSRLFMIEHPEHGSFFRTRRMD